MSIVKNQQSSASGRLRFFLAYRQENRLSAQSRMMLLALLNRSQTKHGNRA